LRRIVYYSCCFIAIIGAYYVDLSPVVICDLYKPDKDSHKKANKTVDSLLSESAQKGFEQKKQAEIGIDTLAINGNEWFEIYNYLSALKEGRSIPEEYKKRLPSNKYPMSVFFFMPDEMPIKKVAYHFKSNNQILYLQIFDENHNKQLQNKDISKAEKYLRLKYQIYSLDDFSIGGINIYPPPPTWMLYPYREYSLFLLLAGVAFYILLPVKNISSKVIRYPRWRVILCDLGATILTFVFFGMPFFIIGSTQKVFSSYILFSSVFWLISLIGLYTIKVALWYGSYQIDISKEGLKIADYRGIRQLRFDDMEYFQPAIFRPPKWFIFFTWFSALLRRNVTDLGKAILLSSSETGAIAIKLKNGREFYITVTDQMGSTALKGFEKIIESLKTSDVRELEEVKVIRSMGMEIMK